jgi:hypothetical protein
MRKEVVTEAVKYGAVDFHYRSSQSRLGNALILLSRAGNRDGRILPQSDPQLCFNCRFQDKPFAWHDRLLADTGNTVHFDREFKPVPVDAGRLRKVVSNTIRTRAPSVA